VKVLESSLGAENDYTARAFNNLARVCMHQGKYSEARNLCQMALNTLEKIFDQNHPSVTEVLATIAQLRQKAGNVLAVAKLQR
jgi:lipopolysaccharide biosynthesis regulator YciM